MKILIYHPFDFTGEHLGNANHLSSASLLLSKKMPLLQLRSRTLKLKLLVGWSCLRRKPEQQFPLVLVLLVRCLGQVETYNSKQWFNGDFLCLLESKSHL